MRTILSFLCAAAGIAACASDETSSPGREGEDAASSPDAAGSDAGGDAKPCTVDCEYFAETCAPGAFCVSGPFDANPAVGVDWRTKINVIRGRAANDVWMVGAVGTAAHFDGTSWTVSEMGTQDSQRSLWLRSSGEISLGTNKKMYTRGIDTDGGPASAGGWSLREIAAPTGFGNTITAALSLPGKDMLWVATNDDLWRLRIDGSTFESVPGIPAATCAKVPCKKLRGLAATSASTIWAVGDVGASVRISGADGDAPVVEPFNSLTWVALSSVWAASDNDVWAVGGSGVIRHYTGDPIRWGIVENVPTTVGLNAVWGTSPTDIWAVGNDSVVLHYDGARWSRATIAGLGSRRPNLFTVWAADAGHVWIGGEGVVLTLNAGGNP